MREPQYLISKTGDIVFGVFIIGAAILLYIVLPIYLVFNY